MPPTTAGGWRQRWAEQENARRLVVYNDSRRRWEYERDLLVWYHSQAASAGAAWSAANVVLVEMPDTLHLFGPVHSVYSPTRRGGGFAPLTHRRESERDTGTVTVDEKRVLFTGTKGNKEWSFSQLTGVAHGSATPMSLMRVANRQRLSGFVFDAATAAAFQFQLSLGLALHRGDRAGFVAHLDGMLAHHLAQQPSVPLPAQPTEAPSQGLGRIIFGPPGSSVFRQLAPTLGVLTALLCVSAALLAPPSPKNPSTSDVGLRASAAAPVVAVIPSAVVASSAVVAPTSAVPTSAAPPAPAPVKTTKAAPPPVDLCGAPANPWGYNFCGGSNIPSPPNNFCSYFNCIPSFWNQTNGYVMQCKDGMYSHSGGVSGSCSSHQGNSRPLKQ